MTLDIDTLVVVSAVIMIVTCFIFTLTTALRHNDSANRIWSTSFMAAVSAGAFSAVWGLSESAPMASIAAASASIVFSIGALWSGMRAFNGRSSLLWIVVLAGLGAGATVLSEGPQGDSQSGSLVKFALASVLACLAGAEMRVGATARNLNARILRFVLWAFGLACAVGVGVSLAVGTNESTLPSYLNDRAILVLAVVYVSAAMCLSALRVEKYGTWWSGGEAPEKKQHFSLGALTADNFSDAAKDRLSRMALLGGNASIVVAEINDLEEINTAFGRDAGDRALVDFAQILRTHVPVSALIGHLRAGRFAVLSIVSSPEDATAIVSAIQLSLLETTLVSGAGLRIDARFGSADTFTKSANFDQLMQAAAAKLDAVHART
ncbi:MAG: hypothetical protein JWP10_803 [Nocardioidaceae bacterium]|nr:hypothetical protein [Nocardioidaceae bacterium]